MKTVYVIGAGSVEIAKRALELKEDLEIICVESMEDVPISARLSSDLSVIQEIRKFTAPLPIPEVKFYDNHKKKGHERPYKYHR